MRKNAFGEPLPNKLSTFKIAQLMSTSNGDNPRSYYLFLLSDMYQAYKNEKLKAIPPCPINDLTIDVPYIERDKIFFDMCHATETDMYPQTDGASRYSHFLSFYKMEVYREDFFSWYGFIPEGSELAKWWLESELNVNLAVSTIVSPANSKTTDSLNVNITVPSEIESIYEAQNKLTKKFGDVEWSLWLMLPSGNWTKEQAAMLLCNMDPNKFRLIENDNEFITFCKPYLQVLRILSPESQTIIDWFRWYKFNGLIDYLPDLAKLWYKSILSKAEGAKTKSNGYIDRHEMFLEWFCSESSGLTLSDITKDDTEDKLKKMHADELQAALIEFARKNNKQNIWSSGFDCWLRIQHFGKLKRGPKNKT